ncbi:uncharacterized protein [Drosophila virilis]|uniref:Uncharacterized protein n=1 Tax=Drosophila virilis TaxID=7244 RepID=B4MFQ9_DROVI|nr:uncharacterized protein LOC6636364 [Drosophila virilis]EDW57230.1 uncharacterized protein Dvir_GJ14986 [Drosophila virilis]
MAENSCCKWKEILSKNLPRKCPANCFNPLNGPCPDYKIVDVVNREASVVKAILEPEPPIRRIIDTKALCSKCCGLAENTPEKCCNLCDAQNGTQRNNLCSAACRPLGTKLHLEEWTKRPRPKPTYKHSLFVDSETLAGRVFPVKFRLRRIKNHCSDCGKELYFRDPITDNSNVVVLTNCCDVKVYHNRALENWHRVPILSITGDSKMKKKTINEICQLEPKKLPPVVDIIAKSIDKLTISKRKSKKGKKGKKGKK